MDIFPDLCAAAGLPRPSPEYRFAPPRLFRFDWAWPRAHLALEIEGGIYGKGKRCPVCRRRPVQGHNSITGLKRDIEKYNLAALMGWRVLRITRTDFDRGNALALVHDALRR